MSLGWSWNTLVPTELTGGSDWSHGSLGVSVETVAPATQWKNSNNRKSCCCSKSSEQMEMSSSASHGGARCPLKIKSNNNTKLQHSATVFGL